MSNGFYLFIAIAGLITVIITTLLGLFFTRHKVIKYIPAIISAAATAGFWVKAAYFSQGFEDLGYAVLGFIAAIVFVIALLNAIIIELVQRNRRRYR